MKKTTIFLAILSIILLGGSVFLFSTKKNTSDQNHLTIGYSALRISLPIFVAMEKGYFHEEGLTVKLERFDTAQPLISALVAGNIPMAGYSALPITYSAMVRSKTPLYFVSAMMEDQDHRISYLIVPADTPESFTIADLKGKKIGILPTVAYNVRLEEILAKNNIKPDEVEIIQIAPALAPSAMISKQIDVLFTNDPAATTVLQKGIGRLISDQVEVPAYFGEPFLFGSFTIRKDFAEKNPQTTKKVVNALNKAIAFVNSNPGEAKKSMLPYLHETQKPFVEFYPDARYVPSTQVTIDMFQDSADQYTKLGILEQSLDVTDLVITPASF